MRATLLIGLFIFIQALFGQTSVEDTVKIKEVSISPEWEPSAQKIEVEKSFINNPKNENIAEVLSDQSSVFVKSYGIGSLATLSLRGAASNHSNIIWNGIVLNSSANGLIDLALFPTAFIDGADLQMGTSSLESASGGLGGALNLKSGNRKEETYRLQLEQKWGSFGQRTSHASMINKGKSWWSKTQFYRNTADNNFAYRDIGEPGFPEKKLQNASLNQLGIRQVFHWQLSERERLEAELWYFDSNRKLPSIFTVNNVVENQEDENVRILLSYLFYGDNSSLRISTSAFQDEINYRNEVAEIDSESRSRDIKSFLNYELNLPSSWSFQTRLNLNYSELEQPLNNLNLDRALISNYLAIAKSFSNRLIAQLSSRQELIIDEEEAFLPQLQISYSIDRAKRWIIHSQVGKNWKFQNLNDLYWIPGGNPNLKAERSQSAEVSLNYTSKGYFNKAQVEAGITAFKSRIENYIQWQPSAFGFWQAQNIGEVEIQGISTQIKAKYDGKVQKTFWFDYSYTQSIQSSKTRIYDESEGKQLIYIPEHKYAFVTELEWKSWFVNYNLQFMGARYTSSDNREFLPFYTLSDLSLGKKFRWLNHELNFSFAVLNLADEEYQAIEWRPMPGRNFQFTLAYRLHEK